jgi:hypothetical protein
VAPGLDAWRVGPDDSLAANADLINAVNQPRTGLPGPDIPAG